MRKRKIVVFSGAGMSAESGLKTFRDSGGLWEQYRIEDVATPEAWSANPELVLEFYNMRRVQAFHANPNEAHKILAELESDYDVSIITQNVDNLHERAGSTHVLHLHGELDKVRSVSDPSYIRKMHGKPIELGDTCPNGGQLRPHIVWFGEEVPGMDQAHELVRSAEVMIVIGTSLQVYPAAGLVYALPDSAYGVYIDLRASSSVNIPSNFKTMNYTANVGLENLLSELKLE